MAVRCWPGMCENTTTKGIFTVGYELCSLLKLTYE